MILNGVSTVFYIQMFFNYYDCINKVILLRYLNVILRVQTDGKMSLPFVFCS